MKKKFVFAALVAIAPFAAAQANNVGCGAGSILFEGQSGVAPQVLAATTNGIFGNQTFGISSGTLGCSQDGTVSVPHKVAMFIDTNLDKLAYEMAVGEGETLDSLASLIGVSEADRAAFSLAVRTHFGEIISSEQVSSADVADALNRVLASDETLAQYAWLV
jgi:hypothetical protein